MLNPKISVIMPVYNGDKYLKESIGSILEQDFKDFEFIIIDDGSVDKTKDILKSISDRRLVLIENKRNMGVSKSINKGLKIARGEYIARCDADDIYRKDRFKKQNDFLDRNKEYVVVGSNASIIDDLGNFVKEDCMPETDQQIRKTILIRNPMFHPSVMIRRSIINKLGGYRDIFNGAEDYDLWFRMLKCGNLYNIQENLISRRWHESVVTKKNHFFIELKAVLVRIINIF